MKKTEKEIDFSEQGFQKQFRQIERKDRPNAAINKALREAKNRITIYLDADIVEHFKTQAEISKIGYQTLINQTLREKINNPQVNKNADELIEKLLQDKNALSRLKAELEMV
jgi:uncharacterized protein (DUF4415 family)